MSHKIKKDTYLFYRGGFINEKEIKEGEEWLEKAAEMMAQTPMGNQSQQASEGNQTADDVVDADSKMKQ